MEENIGDYRKAIQIYKQISSMTDQEDPMISLRIAKCFIKLKDKKQAVIYLDQALSSKTLELKNPQRLQWLIDALNLSFNQLEDYKKSLIFCDLILEREPQNHQAIFIKGLALK